MFALNRHRRWLLRSSFARALFGLLVLTLSLTGMPRWESHAHAFDESLHEHVHEGRSTDHRSPSADDQIDDAVPVVHAHVTATLAATLPTFTASTVLDRLPDTWRPNMTASSPPASVGPPPYRPPIV